MSIKKKTFLLIFVAIIIFEALFFAVQQYIVFPSFITLEQVEAKQNLDRSILAIQNEIKHLDELCHDWAAWNDTVQFMKDRNENYINGNLVDTTLINARLNLIQYFDVSGKSFYRKTIDLKTEQPLAPGDFNLDELPLGSSLYIDPAQKEPWGDVKVTGIWMNDNSPMMIAVRPILNSENEGPSHGILIMGRLLTNEGIKKISDQTQVDFIILPVGDLTHKAEIDRVLAQRDAGEINPFEKVSNKLLNIYAAFKDIDDNDAFIIRTSFPRDIAREGMETIRFALLFSWLIGLVTLLLIIFILDRMLLNPISHLTKHTKYIQEKGDYAARIDMERMDEIGQLAKAFDGMIGTIESQTGELARMNKELVDLSFRDGLTKVYNRRYFDQQLPIILGHMRREKQPCSLIIGDIDFFKQYNDTYGHLAGDDCLKSVGKVLRDQSRRSLDLVARYGGEEFVLVLPETEAQQAREIAEKLRQAVQNEKIEHRGSSVADTVSISLGVTTVEPGVNAKAGSVITTADKALYEAKKSGRNRIEFKEYEE
ncbi:MAG TPA: diguanylate cyclase [bacterium]|nr:diguanylate cyclase [bacterium]